MQGLTLRVTEEGTELALHDGVQALLRDAAGLHAGPDAADALVRFCVDRRGVWLTVAAAGGAVHVNGRRVRRMAMLRPGDAIYVDGIELVLAAPVAAAPDDGFAPEAGAAQADARTVLRAVGGRHHGRSFTLDRPRLVGSAAEADIRIDDPAFAERHAQLDRVAGQVLLRDLGTPDGSMVNGRAVHDAVLRPGDQLVFDGQHRFVLEGPGPSDRVPPPMSGIDEVDPDEPEARPRRTWRRWPWLLLAALLIAAVLAALLVYGGR